MTPFTRKYAYLLGNTLPNCYCFQAEETGKVEVNLGGNFVRVNDADFRDEIALKASNNVLRAAVQIINCCSNYSD